MNNKIQTGCLLVAVPVNLIKVIKDSLASFLVIAITTVTKDIIELCHRNNIQVAVWNANTAEEFKRIQMMGPDLLMTDRPSLLAPLL